MRSQRAISRQSVVEILAATTVVVLALGIVPTTARGKDTNETPATQAGVNLFSPLELRHVKLGGEVGRRIDMTIDNNLMKLDVDNDFLRPFRERTAGSGFVGVGMLLDAAVGLAAYSNDEKVIERKRYIVDELLGMQEEDGYIGMMKPDARMWSLWDIHEMAYIIHGLVRDYRLFGEKHSLEAAKKVGDYIQGRWATEPDAIPGGGEITVLMAVTGIEPAMLALYNETGCRRYLDFCTQVRKLHEWKAEVVIGRWGPVGGHAYAYCSRSIAQLWLNAIQPDPRLLASSRDVMEFLLNRNGMAVIGTCGYRECWHDSQDGTSHLGETCATAYLLRLWHELILREGKSLYGDLMERAIYNALFAAQSPDGRRIRYYVPIEGPREYFSRDTYCCPNNYRRIVSKLPEFVYYATGDGVAVNLYTTSAAEVQLADDLVLKLRQETDYPSGERVTIHLEPSRPSEFPVLLRIPRWSREATISMNGEKFDEPCPSGSFVTLNRSWKQGDRIDLELPMPWRFIQGRRAQAGRAAVMRGPVVYCLSRSRHEGLKDVDLREIVLVPLALEGPIDDDSVRPGGLACKVRAWSPDQWYPHAKPKLEFILAESVDPASEQTYFKVADPRDECLQDDELIGIGLEQLLSNPVMSRCDPHFR